MSTSEGKQRTRKLTKNVMDDKTILEIDYIVMEAKQIDTEYDELQGCRFI